MARVLHAALTAAIVLGCSKLHAVWNSYDWSSSSRMAWSTLFIGVLVIAAYGMGIPDATADRLGVRSAFAASAVAVGAVSVVQLVVGDALLPRFVVFGAGVLAVPANMLTVAVSERGLRRAALRDRILFVGEEAEGAILASDLLLEPERPAVLSGQLLPSAAAEPGVLEARLRETSATVVVLSRAAYDVEEVVHSAAALHERGVRVRTLSLFYEQWLGKLPVADLERVSLLFDISEVHRVLYGRVRRLIDILLATVGAVACGVLVPVVAAANLVGNRGPLFYGQERIGRRGKPFTIWKFRTMRPGAGGPVNEWTTEDDPRITPVGGILRLTHVDELPQMWNVLRGDMSIVGPRPEQPRYVDELVSKLPFYDLRHLVQPGLTGWAQVKYGYAGSETDALEKLQYEFYYLRHQGLWLDLRILGRTVRSVMGRRGR